MTSVECPVCMDSFDAQTRQPIVLDCGHTVCKACCFVLSASSPAIQPELPPILCPSCRVTSKGRINYMLMQAACSSERNIADTHDDVAKLLERLDLQEAATVMLPPEDVVLKRFIATGSIGQIWEGSLRGRTVRQNLGNFCYFFPVGLEQLGTNLESATTCAFCCAARRLQSR